MQMQTLNNHTGQWNWTVWTFIMFHLHPTFFALCIKETAVAHVPTDAQFFYFGDDGSAGSFQQISAALLTEPDHLHLQLRAST